PLNVSALVARRSKAMKTRHGMGVGLVGLLLSTVGFAAAPVSPETTNELSVPASSSVMEEMEEMIVTARHPNAVPKSVEFATQNPLDLLDETPINAPGLADVLLIK